MEIKEVDLLARQIKEGKKVFYNARILSEEVSSLRQQAFNGKKNGLTDSVIKFTYMHANYIDNALFQSLNAWIEESNPNPPSKRKSPRKELENAE